MNTKNRENTVEDIRYHLDKVLDFVKESPQQVLTILKEEFKPLTDSLNINFLIDRNDLDEKREVYNHISEFISRFIEKPRRLLLYVTYQLCDETDSLLLDEIRPSKDEILEADNILPKVKKQIITVKVNYEFSSKDSKERILRKTEIWHMKNESPANFTVEVKVNWEDLPSDVREEYIKTRERKIIFKLYPKE